MDKEQIFGIIKSHQEKTGDKCGCYITTVIAESKSTYDKVRPFLNELFVEKKIKIRQGINGKLIFINDKNRAQKTH